MKVTVSDITGLGGAPTTPMGVRKWLKASGIAITLQGKRFEIQLEDLPDDVRLAYLRRRLHGLDLPAGDYDDTAHRVFAEASPSRRRRAEYKASIARMLVSLRKRGIKEGERFALVRDRFGSKGTSVASLRRLQRDVQGVDPINYAPALLDDYKATAKQAEMSEDAWRFFMTLIRDAVPDWPLREAWRRVRDAGPAMSWTVPSYSTFYRRWNGLAEAERLHARLGRHDTAKRLSIPAHTRGAKRVRMN